MFNLFFKKYIYNFYLPKDILIQLTTVDSDSLSILFVKKGIHFNKIKVSSISNYLYYISIDFCSEKDLDNFQKFMIKYRELLPPWITFPDIFQGFPRWNQGYEEDYCIKNWLPYWESMDRLEKEKYMIKYNCPKEWRLWLDGNIW